MSSEISGALAGILVSVRRGVDAWVNGYQMRLLLQERRGQLIEDIIAERMGDTGVRIMSSLTPGGVDNEPQ